MALSAILSRPYVTLAFPPAQPPALPWQLARVLQMLEQWQQQKQVSVLQLFLQLLDGLSQLARICSRELYTRVQYARASTNVHYITLKLRCRRWFHLHCSLSKSVHSRQARTAYVAVHLLPVPRFSCAITFGAQQSAELIDALQALDLRSDTLC